MPNCKNCKCLEIVDDDESVNSELNDPTYEPSSEGDSESEYSSSDYDTSGTCYFCNSELEFEENQYFDEQAGRFYCKACYEHVFEH
jgi:hypothetical protein